MKKPFYISQQTWEKLSFKEQDFIIFLKERRFTKSQIMRKLYINTDMGYWKLQKRVNDKIKDDINKVYKK
jgi:hypothetical protein